MATKPSTKNTPEQTENQESEKQEPENETILQEAVASIAPENKEERLAEKIYVALLTNNWMTYASPDKKQDLSDLGDLARRFASSFYSNQD